MSEQDFWIRNGVVVNGEGLLPADVHVHDEKIAAVVPRDSSSPQPPAETSTQSVDAARLWILPGGVDAHVHFGMPLRDGIISLGWRESSEAALLGGTTTVIDFANPERGESLTSAVDRWLATAEDSCLCDFGLHATLGEINQERLAELPALVARGIPSFKAFLAYKDRLMLTPEELERLMSSVATCGGRLLVHAEDGELNAAAAEQLIQTGRTSPEWHPRAHPAEAELKAITTTLEAALRTSCPLTIVHISLAESVRLLRRARRELVNTGSDAQLVTGEVCLHHLFASSGHCQDSYEACLRSVVSPPIREVHDSMGLLAGLERGDLDLLSSDHCEFQLAVKKREARRGFTAIPNGAGGVGERLVMAYAKAVRTEHLSLTRWVQTCCENPAELMGLAGRKGKIAPGYDADLVLFEPEAEYRWQPLGQSDPTSSLYAGSHVVGAVSSVWRRGLLVVANGKLLTGVSQGRFLSRS